MKVLVADAEIRPGQLVFVGETGGVQLLPWASTVILYRCRLKNQYNDPFLCPACRHHEFRLEYSCGQFTAVVCLCCLYKARRSGLSIAEAMRIDEDGMPYQIIEPRPSRVAMPLPL